MRPHSRLWFPCVCVMTLLLAVPALAGAKDKKDKRVLGEGVGSREAQLIGSSEDEQRFVFRVYADATGADALSSEVEEEEPKDPLRGADGFCKGYVNHEGKPFRGSLELQVFDKSGRVEVLPIQDDGPCTPPKRAAQRLTEAKKKLAGLGISLERRGPVLVPKPEKKEMRLEVKQGAQAPYTLQVVYDLETEELTDNGTRRLHGTMELLMHRGGKQQVLWKKKINEERDTRLETVLSVERVDVSPSGGRVVLLESEVLSSTRGWDEKLWVEAVVDVPGDATAKAE